MKNLSDERLKSIFKDKLNDYEADPAEDSWEKVFTLLPNESFHHTHRIAIIASSIVILIISVFTGYIYFYDNVQSGKAFTKDYAQNANDQKQNKNLKNRKGDLASQAQRGSATSQGGLPSQPFDSNSYHESPTVALSTNTSSNSSDLIDKSIQSSDSNLHGSRAMDNYILTEASLKTDTLFLKNELGIIKDSVAANQVTDCIKPDEKSLFSGDLIIGVSPFYSAGVFRPLQNDNVEIDNFSQSSSLFKNRVGLALAIGYSHKIVNKTELEYLVGYKILSKSFQYRIVGFNGERVDVSKRKVSGIMQNVQIGVALKTNFFHPNQLAVLSIAYESTVGKGRKTFSPYVSKNLFSFGIGIERRVTDRICIQSGFSYGIPLGNEFEHFVLNPMQVNAGLSWKIRK